MNFDKPQSYFFIWLLLLGAPVGAQGRNSHPYSAYDCAQRISHQEKTRAIRNFIAAADSLIVPSLLADPCSTEIIERRKGPGKGDWSLFLAELMKVVGDYRARSRYEDAIKADQDEAAFPYFYGEYLRNFRGAEEPLYPDAERQYMLCREILDRVKTVHIEVAHDKETLSRLERSLVALHQRDGLPLATRGGETPLVSFASIFRAAEANVDLDRTSDIRDYTAAAAFAQSAKRKDALLTRDEYRSLIRVETPIESFDRVRFRDGDMPVIDVLYSYRHTSNIAPETYEPPFTFVPLQLNTWGVGLSKPFSLGDAVDISISGSFQQSWRTGLVEYHPDTTERISQFQGSLALSRFLGRDKLNISTLYAFQTIHPELEGSPNRERTFLAPAISYDFYRPYTFGEHFQTRGIGIFGGALFDRETYPVPPGEGVDTLVGRKDYYAGVSARGLDNGRWDITVQPTFFSSTVKPDHTQDNSQYRTNAVVLYRIVDEERTPGLPGGVSGTHLGFLHVVLNLRQDTPRTGIAVYRNYKAGAELDGMWYTTRRGGITFLSSIRYDFQRFYALDKNQNLFAISLSMGF